MLAGYNNAFGYLPPIRNALRPEQMTASPWLKAFADLAYTCGVPVWSYSFSKSQARPILQGALTEYYRGNVSAKAALEDASHRWDALVTAQPGGK
jgi:hypothetical protein